VDCFLQKVDSIVAALYWLCSTDVLCWEEAVGEEGLFSGMLMFIVLRRRNVFEHLQADLKQLVFLLVSSPLLLLGSLVNPSPCRHALLVIIGTVSRSYSALTLYVGCWL